MSVYLGNNLLAGAIDAANQDGSNIANSFSSNLVTKMSDTANIYMSGMSMPSGTYVDLTLGANGTTYTAPANGYFYANFTGTNNLSMFLENDRIAIGGSYPTNSSQNVWLPVRKGDRAKLFYNGSVAHFRFVYANGSESEAS